MKVIAAIQAVVAVATPIALALVKRYAVGVFVCLCSVFACGLLGPAVTTVCLALIGVFCVLSQPNVVANIKSDYARRLK